MMAYVLALPAYKFLIGPEQTAWLEWRLGVRNVLDLHHPMLKLRSEGVPEALVALMDLATAFPKLRRQGIRAIYEAVGFPEEWIILRDNLQRMVTIWAKISGRVDYWGALHSPLAAG